MQKKISTVIIFMILISFFVNFFSIHCLAQSPPEVSDIPDQTIVEGLKFTTITLDDYVTDAEDPDSAIVWTYSGNVVLTVDITDRIATIGIPSVDWHGAETITFIATDTEGANDSDSATFTVIGVNNPPVFGTPSPPNGSTNTPLNFVWSIPINDTQGDLFNWTIQCSNGQAQSGTDASNGTKLLALSNLRYLTMYTVWVNATDPAGSGNATHAWFVFTTKPNQPPVFGAPSPENNSLNIPLNLTWDILISDPEADRFNFTIDCSNGQTKSQVNVSNGTKTLALSNLTYETMYTVWVNATDINGSSQYTRAWFVFTTMKVNQSPIFGTPSPANGSPNNPLAFTWSIPINDPEGDLFSWTIHCSNGQTNSSTVATNGTKTLALSGLAYRTTYKVWVNATDPTGNGSYTRKWFTFTTHDTGESPPPSPPPGPPGQENNTNPVADTSAGEPYQGMVNVNITFNGSRSYDPDGTIIKWAWVFGDNTNGTGKSIQHTYSKEGTYNVNLTVTDNKGATNTDTTTCVISQRINRSLSEPIITGPRNGKKNTMYTYTALSTDGDNDSILYLFDWGDPMSVPQSSGFLPHGSSYTVSHSWATEGRYIVTVTATDAQNKTSSSTKITIYIDALQTADIGYLLDNNGDGIYDSFYSDVLNRTTTVESKKGVYVIDSDGNGEWDYTFDSKNGLVSYQPRKTPGFELCLVLYAITLLMLWRRKGKK